MQHRMLAVAALAAVSVAAPIAAAQGATSTAKAVQGVFYGGVTATGFPVVIQLSKTGRKVVRATIGLELKCQTPGDITLPDSFRNIPVSRTGRFSHTYGPEEIAADPATGVSKVQVSGSISGKWANRAHTRIKGAWTQKIVAISAADPTGATILDTCDSGVVNYQADQ